MNIGLIGHMASGKDEFAKYLPDYSRLAFGDPIRHLANTLKTKGMLDALWEVRDLMKPHDVPFGILRDVWKWQHIKCSDKKNRELLQTMGTQLRKVKDDIWIQQVVKEIKKNPMKKFVVTDVRRDSEVAALVSLGFTMVAISADKEARVARLIARDGSYDPKWEKNIAESEIESLMNNRCGFTVDNNGTKEELQTQASVLLATLG